MIYIFDIDGTLTKVGDRKKELEKTPKDWDAFYARCGEDKPNLPVVGLARELWPLGALYYFTGRRESCRGDTIDWLERHRLPWLKPLCMRKNGDHRPDTIVKVEFLEQAGLAAEDFKNRIVIFEDRDCMVMRWRELGYTCLQVADGNF